jgi:hypothetical protein
MIDPVNITKFDNTKEQLEEVLLFWVLAAGKNAITASRCLDNFLIFIHNKFSIKHFQPFDCIKKIQKEDLPLLMKNYGIGCYNNKAKTFWQLANSNLDLNVIIKKVKKKIY